MDRATGLPCCPITLPTHLELCAGNPTRISSFGPKRHRTGVCGRQCCRPQGDQGGGQGQDEHSARFLQRKRDRVVRTRVKSWTSRPSIYCAGTQVSEPASFTATSVKKIRSGLPSPVPRWSKATRRGPAFS